MPKSYANCWRNQIQIRLIELVVLTHRRSTRRQVKPDDHSEVVPLLPIPNRTVKRLCANDSADSRVKVGHRQANILDTPGVFRVFVSSQRRPICAARRGWMSRLGIQH